MADTSQNKEPIKVTEDGGVLKEIIKPGEGERPKSGAEVKVHYTGKLEDGTVFDSSRDRGQPFSFKLGEGKVIKGWDKGVKTMVPGEISTFTIKSEYGYGSAGSPPKIPPNATLIFEIEMLSFNLDEDITNDGGVLKRILVKGTDWQTPNDEAVCDVHLIGKLNNGDTFIEKDVKVTIGEEEICEGLERAIKSMKKGEKALVKIAPSYGYGSSGESSLKIPPNETLHYEVHLKDFVKAKESWEYKKAEEKINAAIQRKDQGNELFKQGKYSRALKKYQAAFKFIEQENNFKDKEKPKANATKALIQNNLAMVYLKLNDFQKVLENSNKVLQIEPNNTKALFRRGVAYSNTHSWDLAKKDFITLLEMDKNNKEAQIELQKLNNKIQKQNQKDKKTFQNLFQRMASLENEEKKP